MVRLPAHFPPRVKIPCFFLHALNASNVAVPNILLRPTVLHCSQQRYCIWTKYPEDTYLSLIWFCASGLIQNIMIGGWPSSPVKMRMLNTCLQRLSISFPNQHDPQATTVLTGIPTPACADSPDSPPVSHSATPEEPGRLPRKQENHRQARPSTYPCLCSPGPAS